MGLKFVVVGKVQTKVHILKMHDAKHAKHKSYCYSQCDVVKVQFYAKQECLKIPLCKAAWKFSILKYKKHHHRIYIYIPLNMDQDFFEKKKKMLAIGWLNCSFMLIILK